jgi:hypothetical protein
MSRQKTIEPGFGGLSDPCARAWAPKRGGLAGVWETKRILRRSGLIDPDLAAPHGAVVPRDVGGRRIRRLPGPHI